MRVRSAAVIFCWSLDYWQLISVADPGCLSRIRIFFLSRIRIFFYPWSASKNKSILTQRIVSKLSEIWFRFRFQLHIWTIKTKFLNKNLKIIFFSKLYYKENFCKFQQTYCKMWSKKMLNLSNQIHNFISSFGSRTVINCGSSSDFLINTVPVPLVKRLRYLRFWFRFRFHNAASRIQGSLRHRIPDPHHWFLKFFPIVQAGRIVRRLWTLGRPAWDCCWRWRPSYGTNRTGSRPTSSTAWPRWIRSTSPSWTTS